MSIKSIMKQRFFSRSSYMFFIDILLSIILLSLFSLLLTGLKIHEWAGFFFFVLVVLHLLYSWVWISQSVKKIRQVNSSRQQRVVFFLNALLFVLIVLQVVSGLVISQVALPAIGISTIRDWSWRSLHSDCSRLFVIVISLHIALNWRRIIGYCRKKMPAPAAAAGKKKTAGSMRGRWLGRALLIVLAALGIAALAWWVKGAPLATNRMPGNAIERFSPILVAGLVQYAGGAIVLTILVYMAHRWLRLRP